MAKLKINIISGVIIVLISILYTCQKSQKHKEPSFTEEDPPRVLIGRVKKWLDSGEGIFLIDSRKEADWMSTTRKVKGALRVSPDSVEAYLPKIPKDKIIVIICA